MSAFDPKRTSFPVRSTVALYSPTNPKKIAQLRLAPIRRRNNGLREDSRPDLVTIASDTGCASSPAPDDFHSPVRDGEVLKAEEGEKQLPAHKLALVKRVSALPG